MLKENKCNDKTNSQEKLWTSEPRMIIIDTITALQIHLNMRKELHYTHPISLF